MTPQAYCRKSCGCPLPDGHPGPCQKPDWSKSEDEPEEEDMTPEERAAEAEAETVAMPTRTVTCPFCDGTTLLGMCSECHGTGRVKMAVPVRVAMSDAAPHPTRTIKCPRCDGAKHGTYYSRSRGFFSEPCGVCAGRGKVKMAVPTPVAQATCPTCDGYGTILTLAKTTKICPTCHRTGKAPTQ